MTKDLLSIIIPAYNPDDWLRGILETLKKQMIQYPSVEIIVVDDGSTVDVSWVKEYPNVRYSFKDNGGEPTARNHGLEMVTGEYITFIDCDDEIYDNYLAVVFENMRAGYDWVSYDWECDRHREWAVQNKNTLMVNCAVWAYSYRTEFIGNTQFDNSLKLGCDVEWLGRLLRDDCKHCHDHRVIYNYRWNGNENSLCHRKLRGEIR